MSVKKIETTGDLRRFLSDAMVGVNDGSMALDRASAISKLAAQVNESMKAEIRYQQTCLDLGRKVDDFGTAIIAADDTHDNQ